MLVALRPPVDLGFSIEDFGLGIEKRLMPGPVSNPKSAIPNPKSPEGVCRSLRAIPTPWTWGPPRPGASGSTLARRLPSRVHDATNVIADASGTPAPQLILVSLCLADECHRPNCQRPRCRLSDRRLIPVKGSGRVSERSAGLITSTDVIGRCKAALKQPTPAVFRPSAPARKGGRKFMRQRQYYPQKTGRSTPRSGFLPESGSTNRPLRLQSIRIH
jgi:hypothetical protein